MFNFWQKLPSPFFALAPLDDVTDAAFRAIIALTGKPDVFYTEFTSADGLCVAPEKGQISLRRKLIFGENERPIVAQLFSSSPEYMEKAAALVESLGFDGVDINMGCPDDGVEKGGSGAALIKRPERAREIIRAAKRGAPSLPVSVKTRCGYNAESIDEWLSQILAENPAALAVHLRTRKEMSAVPAHWEWMPRIVALRDTLAPETVLMGNGDVKDMLDARQKASESGCEGIMLGRAIFGNPWLFKNAEGTLEITPVEKIQKLMQHIEAFDSLLGNVKGFSVMKKHFKAYISGWDHAKDLRVQLMETNTADEALQILQKAR